MSTDTSSIKSASTAYDIEQQQQQQQQCTTEEELLTRNKKLLVVTICCITGIISPLSANIYFPALVMIQQDLHTTTELINLTVTVYMIFQGLSPSFWGSLADRYGRRPVYLSTLFVYMVSCIGLALSPNYWVLLVLRMLQAFGSSSVIAIGAGVVGDISTPCERGSYFGLFSMGQMLGTVIGPVLGGIISEQLSWRWIFWILLIIGSVLFLVILVFLPETLKSKVQPQKFNDDDSSTIVHKDTSIFQPFLFLLEKDVLLILLFNGIHYATYYCYLTTTTDQFKSLYGLTEIQIGLCFLCQGVGCVTGSFIQGKLLDHDYNVMTVKYAPKEVPIYKTRFRSMYHNAGLLQVITLFYGWMLYIKAPLPAVLVLQFIVGYANTCLFNIFQTLVIDLFPGNSASITASNNLIRCMLGAIATVSIEPGIQSIGVGWMFTTIGCICVVSNVFIPVILVYGPQWKLSRQ
jgi:multidrug resistance protein